MPLTAKQRSERDGKITSSMVAPLMTGDLEKVMNYYRLLIGDPSYVEEDLSDVWPVQLGSATESLNLDWFERKLGPLSRRGEVVAHAELPWAACTLDGWSNLHACPVECKHVGGHEPLSIIAARYLPQITWQMLVTGARRCALSVIMGASAPVVEFVDITDGYAAELMSRAAQLMLCVETLTPPVDVPAITAPVKAEIAYDMSGNNHWAANAATWLSTQQAAKDCLAAEKELKGDVPPDALRAFGHGVEIRRDRAGRLSLRERP